MRSSSEALKIALSNIKLAVQDGKYLTAGRLATDFIKLAYNLESKTELFVGEVLEGVCLQIGHELRTHEIPDEDKNKLNENMIKHMDNLQIAYNTQDGLWSILVDLRNYTTVFQFTSDVKYKTRRLDRFRGSIND